MSKHLLFLQIDEQNYEKFIFLFNENQKSFQNLISLFSLSDTTWKVSKYIELFLVRIFLYSFRIQEDTDQK